MPRSPEKPYREPRTRSKVTVEYAPCNHPYHKKRPFILRTGRGDSRLSITEAKDLAAMIGRVVASAVAAETESADSAGQPQ